MKTFKHKNNGSTMTYKDGCMKIENLVIEGEPNLNYWEEVLDKEWEILSLSCNGIILHYEGETCVKRTDKIKASYTYDKKDILGRNGTFIHSVKRLLDGEVFTIGDNVKNANHTSNILEIFIKDDKLLYSTKFTNCANILTNCNKIKQPLFITEDGYDIFEGDSVYILNFEYKVVTYIPFCPNLPLLDNYRVFKNLDNLNKYTSYTTAEGNIIREGQVFYIYNNVKFKCEETSYGHFKNEKYDGKRFKTKEEVEQIILMNKPCLSLNDLLSVWGTCNTKEMYASSPLFSNFKKLANEKIVGRV